MLFGNGTHWRKNSEQAKWSIRSIVFTQTSFIFTKLQKLFYFFQINIASTSRRAVEKYQFNLNYDIFHFFSESAT